MQLFADFVSGALLNDVLEVCVKKTLGLLVLASLIPCQVFAAGYVNATVAMVRIDQSGRGMVFFDQNIGGTPPGCVISNYRSALGFDTSTAGGRAIYAMALAAKATGAAISVSGLGTCTIFGGFVEDWDTGVVQ